jgi:hypothetical protein
MADVKISGLPASTVPLAGTEVLPIVQGGATKQVSIANVTAGRAIAATSITTDTYKAASSSGGALQNSGGTPQLQWGASGGNNLSVDVAININPANAAVAISPTGTGTVAINPATASTMNNVAIGGTTPLAGAFTTATANSFIPNSATIPTNGVFLPATNSVGVATNSNERARFFASGGVSIGNTTDPGNTNLSVTGFVRSNSIASPLSGTVSNAVSGTAYTICSTVSFSCYQVFAFLYNNGGNFTAVASFINDGTFLTRYNYANGAFFGISVSGTNIQVTQSSGGPADIVYRVVQIIA